MNYFEKNEDFENFEKEKFDGEYWYKVQEFINEFRKIYPKPIDLFNSNKVNNENCLSDIIKLWLKTEKNGMIFFKPVINELVKLKYAEIWKNF
jgi:hypothetical protein